MGWRSFAQSVLLVLVCAAGVSGDANRWQGTDSAWTRGANWSAGKAPAAGDGREVVIGGGLKAYPVLAGDATVDGGLRIERGATLTLAGHTLTVARGTIDMDTNRDPRKGRGLTVLGTLDASGRESRVRLARGDFENGGKVTGALALEIDGCLYDVSVTAGGAQLASLRLGASAYPYRVFLKDNVAVAGDLVLAGGHLFTSAQKAVHVQGDLVFAAGAGRARLSLPGELFLDGTIRSDGSADCDGAYTGWVRMRGAGDQTITPGGLLPPIRIGKASGKVSVSADLATSGLHIMPGNTLVAGEGCRLIFGSGTPEWHFDPEGKLIVRNYVPWRTSRDLINEGTLSGRVPFVLRLNVEQCAWEVSGVYAFERRAPADDTLKNPTAGNLSVNRPDSRLRLEGGKLLLDKERVGSKARGGGADEALLDMVDRSVARLTGLKARKAAAPAAALTAGNVAPYAWVRAAPSVGLSLRRVTDGSTRTGAGFRPGVMVGGTYEFVLPQPATISRVRIFQGHLFAISYLLYADTTGNGTCDTILASSHAGAPGVWLDHAFGPTKVYRLKMRATEGQRGWERSFPELCEFEIYADAATAKALAAETRRPGVPADAAWLKMGEAVAGERAPVAPEARVLRSVMVDLWMFGIHPNVEFKFKHLRDYGPLKEMIRNLKDLGANAVTLFIEADPHAFWPSANFKSITNTAPAKAEAPAVEIKEEEAPLVPGLEGLDEGERKTPAKAKAAAKAVKPTGRDLLREFCEAMHEAGFPVYILFRGSIMDAYTGPPSDVACRYWVWRQEAPWRRLFEEIAARGVDGIYVCADEEYWGPFDVRGKVGEDDAYRVAFEKRWGCELPKGWKDTENYRKHILFHYEQVARLLGNLSAAVKAKNPRILTMANMGSHAISCNNRMTYGSAYDVMGHEAGLDFIGTDYVPEQMRTFVGSAANRQATMVLGFGGDGAGVRCVMQGAGLINYYRYNYIYLYKTADRLRREFGLIEGLARWGVREARAPRKIAVLLSRASEDWWDLAHGVFWLGWSIPGKQGFWSDRIATELLSHLGYPFDVYYLDWPKDLKELGRYKLIVLPFPYAVSGEAAEAVARGRAAGAKVLIVNRQGEVNEVGTKWERPALADMIERGSAKGDVVYLKDDLVTIESSAGYPASMKKTIDGLLGEERPGFFDAHGRDVEMLMLEHDAGTKIVTVTNRGEGEASVEVGVNVPEGRYAVTALSTREPGVERRVTLGGKAVVARAALARFALKLGAGETVALHVTAAR